MRETRREREGGMSESVWMDEWVKEDESEGGRERRREREGERVLP